MYGYGDENEATLKIENDNNLEYQEDQEKVYPEQEDQIIIQQPIKLESDPSEKVITRIVQVLEIIALHTVQYIKP